MGSLRDRHSCFRCRCKCRPTWEVGRWNLEDVRWSSFDEVKRNGPHDHVGSDGGNSLHIKHQTEPYTVNSELLVTGFGAISICKVLAWN